MKLKVAGVFALAVALSVALGLASFRIVRPSPAVRPLHARYSPAVLRDQDIAFYEARVARDPYGARDRAALAALYLARGRADGDANDFVRAESLATVSLRTRSKRNSAAAQVLVSALMAEHQFERAWKVMLPEAQLDSSDPISTATLGEIALELGRYSEADSLFARLSLKRTNPSIAPRYARWLELNGKSGEARTLLSDTRKQLEAGFRVPPEQLAWFDLRIGELAFRNGRNDLAGEALDRGLVVSPDDPRLLAAKSRLAFAQSDVTGSIQLGERALAHNFEPATLGLLSEAYEALGDSAKANEYARAMEVSLSNQPGAYHRGWALYLLDHRRQVERVLQKARLELNTRKDVYGYDVLGWALHQAGQPREALKMADLALSRGTQDPMLWYHHGLIALALGDSTSARSDLERAVAINAEYRPGFGPSARGMLESLDKRELFPLTAHR